MSTSKIADKILDKARSFLPARDPCERDERRFERICATKRGQAKIDKILQNQYVTELSARRAVRAYNRAQDEFTAGVKQGIYESTTPAFLILIGRDPEARFWGCTLSRIRAEIGPPHAYNWFIHKTLGFGPGGDPKRAERFLQSFREVQRTIQNSDIPCGPPSKEWHIKVRAHGPTISRDDWVPNTRIAKQCLFRNLDKFFPNGAKEVAHAQYCYIQNDIRNVKLDPEREELADRFKKCDEAINSEIWSNFRHKEAAQMPSLWLAEVDFSAYTTGIDGDELEPKPDDLEQTEFWSLAMASIENNIDANWTRQPEDSGREID